MKPSNATASRTPACAIRTLLAVSPSTGGQGAPSCTGGGPGGGPPCIGLRDVSLSAHSSAFSLKCLRYRVPRFASAKGAGARDAGDLEATAHGLAAGRNVQAWVGPPGTNCASGFGRWRTPGHEPLSVRETLCAVSTPPRAEPWQCRDALCRD